ncbi:MAG: lytic murein transglycosylase [Geminicoccaceae bacterium]
MALRGSLRGSALALLALAMTVPDVSAQTNFSSWLDGFRDRAVREGISQSTLESAFAGVAPIERIIELDRKQPEGRMTFVEYRDKVISKHRINKGRELLRKHASILASTEARFGVPAEVIVALWGIESSFGEFKGRFPVIDALATLAWDGRREELFTRELISALRILDEGHVERGNMFGSWAGAMGQSQFMPSTFAGYAVDADGDGRRDIWSSLPDVFGSMANYLSRIGWDRRYIWGREVSGIAGVPASMRGLEQKASLARWAELGVRRKDGGPLPKAGIDASLVVMDDGKGPAYLIYDNYRVIMRWNRSSYFATSVGLLSDAIRSGS